MNTVNLIGRLTKDPELRYSASGIPNCKFTLAVNRDFVNKNTGEREADFIQCTAFNKTAENLSNYQTKGSRIGVVGRIQTGSYDDQEGKRIYTTDVIVDRIEFLDSKNQSNNTNNTQLQQQQSQQQHNAPPLVSEDQLPF